METNRFNLIDDYLLERLTNTEAQEFEKEMASNDELRKQVELCRELKEAILEEDVANLRKQLTISQNEVIKTQKGGLHNLLKVAAVLMVLSVATFFLWKTTNSPTNLFDKYYSRYVLPSISRGSNPSDQNNQQEIAKLYQHGNFDRAIPALEKYLETRPDDEVSRLMLASAYLESNMQDKAIEMLQSTIKTNPDGVYAETAEWYLCLSYLSEANYNDAFILANKIKTNGGKYASKAKEINDFLTNYLKN